MFENESAYPMCSFLIEDVLKQNTHLAAETAIVIESNNNKSVIIKK